LFYLLAILVYVRAHSEPAGTTMPIRSYLLCLALFVLAILSKPMAVSLPAVLLVLDIYPLQRLGAPGRWMGREVRGVWMEKIPFFVIALADGGVTLYAAIQHQSVTPVSILGLPPRVAIAVYGMAFYLLKTLIPTNLCVLYPLTADKVPLFALPFQLSAAVVLLVTLTCLALRRKIPALLPAWIASAVTLLPVSGLVHSGIQIAADRYTYLGCLSWAVLAGAGFMWVWQALQDSSLMKKALAAIAGFLILVTLGWLTHLQIGVWRDSVALWTRAVAVAPSVTAHTKLADSLLQDGNTLGAVEQYQKAIALKPDAAVLHAYLGRAYMDLQRWDEAASEYQVSVGLEPSAGAFDGLASAKLMLGDVDEAILLFRQALRMKPRDARIRSNLESALSMKESRGQPTPQQIPPEQH
jgi:hypothetical protein